jgi:hypothetical protein
MHPHDTVSGKMIASGIPRTMRCAWLREVKNTAYYLRKEDVIAIKKTLIPLSYTREDCILIIYFSAQPLVTGIHE